MQIIREINDLAAAVDGLKSGGKRLALVPTMGALHAGHMALIEEAKRRADWFAATIFVNPLQFGPSEDLERYPRREGADTELLKNAGCDLLWLPAADQLYPPGFATSVRVAGVSDRWDGESRPGHFAGVATVIAKLLIATRPDVAMFGEKDFQQLAVIRRMVADLGLPVEIIGVPTVRDADGLALSSRNAYLGEEDRTRSVALPRTLEMARDRILAGEPVPQILEDARRALAGAGFSPVDYFALVDPESLEPLDAAGGEMRLIAAATLGGTRLIDNMRVVSATIRQTASPPR